MNNKSKVHTVKMVKKLQFLASQWRYKSNTVSINVDNVHCSLVAGLCKNFNILKSMRETRWRSNSNYKQKSHSDNTLLDYLRHLCKWFPNLKLVRDSLILFDKITPNNRIDIRFFQLILSKYTSFSWLTAEWDLLTVLSPFLYKIEGTFRLPKAFLFRYLKLVLAQ